MSNTIVLKKSTVAGKVPLTTNLAAGELAINTSDGKLYMKRTVGGVDSVVAVDESKLTHQAVLTRVSFRF